MSGVLAARAGSLAGHRIEVGPYLAVNHPARQPVRCVLLILRFLCNLNFSWQFDLVLGTRLDHLIGKPS